MVYLGSQLKLPIASNAQQFILEAASTRWHKEGTFQWLDAQDYKSNEVEDYYHDDKNTFSESNEYSSSLVSGDIQSDLSDLRGVNLIWNAEVKVPEPLLIDSDFLESGPALEYGELPRPTMAGLSSPAFESTTKRNLSRAQVQYRCTRSRCNSRSPAGSPARISDLKRHLSTVHKTLISPEEYLLV